MMITIVVVVGEGVAAIVVVVVDGAVAIVAAVIEVINWTMMMVITTATMITMMVIMMMMMMMRIPTTIILIIQHVSATSQNKSWQLSCTEYTAKTGITFHLFSNDLLVMLHAPEPQHRGSNRQNILLLGYLTSKQHTKCIQGSYQFRWFYVMPHWDRNCRSSF